MSVHAAYLGVMLVNGQYQPILDINETYDGDGQPRSRVQTMYKQGICCDENGNPSEPLETRNTAITCVRVCSAGR